MLDTWHRLERVIKWAGLSVNSFALNIGLKRSENLYQIKKGNNGISRDLATLITTKYPMISKGWLLSGEGEMLIEQQPSASEQGVPYYGMDVLAAVEQTELPEPQSRINVPMFNDCDIAALNIGTAMHPEISAGSIVVLKKWSTGAIVPGESYLVITAYFKGIRIIRFGSDPSTLQLLPVNREQYDPITVTKDEIERLFIVQGIIIKKNL
ncbi:S24 family peptidase [uncultured Alistipes sp.]|uniref:S24 family peptidase n=1 Tax=uncultured Alistipes sp. TaxID=538949 RepID=UPI00260F1853|nr:S24 family peptidase [uncultured Alistipes sp.]